MKKARRVLALTLCIATMLTGVYALEAVSSKNTSYVMEDGVMVTVDTSDVNLDSDIDAAMTKEDVSSNFVHYASGESRVALPNMVAGSSDETAVSNVVGMVLDLYTKQPIANAKINANGVELVSTDKDGRFQIVNLPDGKYDWEVSADGYKNGTYLNYVVTNAGGTNIFEFKICDDREFFVNRDTLHEYVGECAQEESLDELAASGMRATRKPNNPMSSIPTAYSTVKVYHDGITETVDRQEYVYHTVASEQYSPAYYSGLNMSDTDILQVYAAQALICNTYIEALQKVYIKHSGYDVCAPGCHAYDTTQNYSILPKALSAMFVNANGAPSTVILYYKPSSSTYQYLMTEWFSSCKNKGTIDHPDNWPGVTAKSCSDLFTGAGGHRRGYCQSGAAKKALNGNKAVDIAKYYFTNSGQGFSKLVTRS